MPLKVLEQDPTSLETPGTCDCRLQTALPHLDLEPVSLTGIICQTSEPSDSGAQGVPFLLAKDLGPVCAAQKDHGRGHVGDHVWMVHHGHLLPGSTM